MVLGVGSWELRLKSRGGSLRMCFSQDRELRLKSRGGSLRMCFSQRRATWRFPPGCVRQDKTGSWELLMIANYSLFPIPYPLLN
jgi:hypothetical protein